MADEGSESTVYTITPTEAERKAWGINKHRDPTLPPEPPLQGAIGRPLPSSERPNTDEVTPFSAPSDRQGITTQDAIAIDDKLWPRFASEYQEPQELDDEGQKLLGKMRPQLAEQYQEEVTNLIAEGQVDAASATGWVENKILERVKRLRKLEAFEVYRNKHLAANRR